MKILKKRAIASVIDSFIYGMLLEMFMRCFPSLRMTNGIVYLIMLMPFFARDIVFKNASIGKKIMGIEIYDKTWNVPKFHVLFKRSLVTNMFLYLLLYKAFFTDKNYLIALNIEYEKLGTFVIDKKFLKRLKEEAQISNRFDEKKDLTQLYLEYLKNVYGNNL